MGIFGRSDASDDSDQKRGMFARLSGRMSKARENFGRKLGDLLLGKRAIDAELMEELETLLLGADVGIEATQAILDRITLRIQRKELDDAQAVYAALREILREILAPLARPLSFAGLERPFTVMVVGVNGAGKTTTIGKLTARLKQRGKTVMLAAGDTFRAAAAEQLGVWAERTDSTIVSRAGADAAAVAHDALRSAMARGTDVLIVDTAGRLHTQTGLMEELKKIKRVLAKVQPGGPHEVLLVLDAGIGQNALAQLQHFNDAVGVTGLCITKLDGTAKGGILFAIAQKLPVPIRYIGVGEGLDDLREFDAQEFVDALMPATSP